MTPCQAGYYALANACICTICPKGKRFRKLLEFEYRIQVSILRSIPHRLSRRLVLNPRSGDMHTVCCRVLLPISERDTYAMRLRLVLTPRTRSLHHMPSWFILPLNN